jgi:hypothetical protein
MPYAYTQTVLERLGAARSQGAGLYAILDGARDPNLQAETIASGNKHYCLFKGSLPPKLATAAPWLVCVDDLESDYVAWLVGAGWGRSWGTFFSSPRTLKDLYRHFRKFLMVKLESGPQVYFRFFDPRVARTFLPTCTDEELCRIFGPTTSWILEGEEPGTLVRFSLSEAGALEIETSHLEAQARGRGDGAIAFEEAVVEVRGLRETQRAEGASALEALQELQLLALRLDPGEGELAAALRDGLGRLNQRLALRKSLSPRMVRAGLTSLLVTVDRAAGRAEKPSALSQQPLTRSVVLAQVQALREAVKNDARPEELIARSGLEDLEALHARVSLAPGLADLASALAQTLKRLRFSKTLTSRRLGAALTSLLVSLRAHA